jgi:hypothetical protein
MNKTITIGDLLTDKELPKVSRLYVQLKDTGTFARTVCDTYIRPKMTAINRLTGQDNDPMYLAYAVEHAMSKMHGQVQS